MASNALLLEIVIKQFPTLINAILVTSRYSSMNDVR